MKKLLLISALITISFLCKAQEVSTRSLIIEENVFYLELQNLNSESARAERAKIIRKLIKAGWILQTADEQVEDGKPITVWKFEKHVVIKKSKDNQ